MILEIEIMVKKINIKLQSIETKGGYQTMGQNVGDWAKKWWKIKKGEQKDKKSLPKMADCCHFFPSNRGKWRDQAFIEGQTPPSPLLYHHLSQKNNNNNNIIHAICVTDLGATQNPEFSWTKPKAICGWGTFLSVFGSGQIGNLILGRGVFLPGY